MGAGKILRSFSLHGHSGAFLNTFQIDVELLTLGEQKGCMWMPNFQNLLVLAISTDRVNPINFSKPAPEASPVLTLGKTPRVRYGLGGGGYPHPSPGTLILFFFIDIYVLRCKKPAPHIILFRVRLL